jgi:hypothetical protein
VASGPERHVTHEDRRAIGDQVHVRGLVADVDQGDHPVPQARVVLLERIVQRERLHVDHAGRQPGIGQEAHPVLDQLPLRGHKQHRHLRRVLLRIEDLEVELHVLHVERHVLLGLPADHLACVVLAHPIHGDLLDDHVMTAYGRDDVLLLEPRTLDEGADGLGDEHRIHDLALDDRIGHERTRRHLDDLRLGLRVIDHDELHDAAADVEPCRQFAPAKQSHYSDSV